MAPSSLPDGPGSSSGAPVGGACAVDAVRGLLARLLPAEQQLFELQLTPAGEAGGLGDHGGFAVEVARGVVSLTGSSGVELASALHHFIKYFAGGSVSWAATGGLQLNAELLSAERLAAMEARGRVAVARAVPLTYYQNIVTLSYSMAFWEWERWEAELDWMALQGINLPLMPLGMEALLAATFAQFGVAPEQLADFFPGPAFLAWGRMGNIQGYAGPLPPAYMAKQLALAKRVVARMRALGMTPVFPAFAGFVPAALAAAHPGARVAPATCWCHFPAGLCCPLMLDPADPLYAAIGSAYITTLRDELGWDTGGSYYAADTFNEMAPSSADPGYLSSVAAAVYGGMAAADPGAVWVMQAWLFFSDARFWQPPQIQALLSGVPRGRLLLLDLFADEHPVWSRTAGLYGHPFIWTMLHNFGGNLEMYGALPAVAEGVAAALAAPGARCVGVGLAPEGLEQNPVVYEFMAELAYAGRAEAAAAPGGLGGWFAAYGGRRYSGAGPLPPPAAAALSGAWQLLGRALYSCRDGQHNTVADIPTSRPGLSRAEVVGWGLAPHLWYDVGDVRAGWELLLAAAASAPALGASSAFVYDLLDVSRELLSKIAGRFWADAADAYRGRSLPALRAAGAALTGLLEALDELLGCHQGFMLGPALARARAYAAPAPAPGGADAQPQQGPGGSSSGSATASLAWPADAAMAERGAGVAASRRLSSSGGSLDSASTEVAGLLAAATAAPPAAPGGAAAPAVSDSSDGSDDSACGGAGGASDGAASTPQQQPPQPPEAAQLAAFYEWNLRTQLTIWGTSASAGDSEVSDYANKEWAGLISSFYLPRWRAWLARLEADLTSGRPYDAAAWRLEVLMMTYRWIATGSTDTSAPPPPAGAQQQPGVVPPVALQPRGDALQLSREAYERYGRLLAPGCAATAATAAAAAAAAAAGLPVPPPGSGSVVATAAAAAAVAVAGAAAAAAAGQVAAPAGGGAGGAAPPAADEVMA